MRNLGQRSKNDLSLLYVLIDITGYSSFYMPKYSIISTNSYVLAFSHIKATECKTDVTVTRLVNSRPSFEQFG